MTHTAYVSQYYWEDTFQFTTAAGSYRLFCLSAPTHLYQLKDAVSFRHQYIDVIFLPRRPVDLDAAESVEKRQGPHAQSPVCDSED